MSLRIIVLQILLTFNPLLTGSQECIQRQYKGNPTRILCVCNATYCDNVRAVRILKRYQAAIYSTTKSGARFQRTISNFKKLTRQKGDSVKINGQERLQSIIGFGGAFTDSVGINIKSLSPGAQENLLQSYFGKNGLQYSTGRVPIASCDFSTREYSYDDTPDDFALQNFNLAKEDTDYKESLSSLKNENNIPFILEALNLTKNKLQLFASPWSAPGWMKTNGKMHAGGALIGDGDSRYHITWAKYYVRFLEEYAKYGIKFWGLTVENEPSSGAIPNYPWQAMYFSAETERDFVKNHLGPELKNSSIGKNIALMIMDDNRYLLPTWANKVLKDDKASEYISGVGVHWYGNSYLFPPSRLTKTHDSHPDKFILATEACNGYRPWDKGPKLGSWSRAESYAIDIIENLMNWVSGWTDWNLCLDLYGGPNWAHNYVDSPIIVNSTADEFYKQPMFYIMGHFSKFIRPGSVRIGIELPKNLHGVAVATPFQQRVLTLLNTSNRTIENLVITDATMIDKALTVNLEPSSITTIVWNKVK